MMLPSPPNKLIPSTTVAAIGGELVALAQSGMDVGKLDDLQGAARQTIEPVHQVGEERHAERTPRRAATSALSPMAITCRPKVVRVTSRCTSTRITAAVKMMNSLKKADSAEVLKRRRYVLDKATGQPQGEAA